MNVEDMKNLRIFYNIFWRLNFYWKATRFKKMKYHRIRGNSQSIHKILYWSSTYWCNIYKIKISYTYRFILEAIKLFANVKFFSNLFFSIFENKICQFFVVYDTERTHLTDLHLLIRPDLPNYYLFSFCAIYISNYRISFILSYHRVTYKI